MIAIPIIAVFIAASVILERIAMGRARARIGEWATQNRFQVSSAKRLWFSAGTWGSWTGSRNRRYFDVTVTDASGAIRTGTVKVWGGYGGITADMIDARWST